MTPVLGQVNLIFCSSYSKISASGRPRNKKTSYDHLSLLKNGLKVEVKMDVSPRAAEWDLI